MEWDRIQESTQAIRDRVAGSPRIGIVFGTGLGALANEIEVEHSISYEDIPHFGAPTVESHSGRLLFGTLEGQPVVAMQGRFHLYEGHSARDVTRPIRVMGQLGVETLVVSGAVGGMNPLWERGDLVVLDDNPLDSIQNSESVSMVMVNGRLYDEHLNEIGNHPRERMPLYWERRPAAAPAPPPNPTPPDGSGR